jgi:hypothetical protein
LKHLSCGALYNHEKVTKNVLFHFINIFGTKSEQLLRRRFSILLMATAVGKNVPNDGARHKSCSLKNVAKF